MIIYFENKPVYLTNELAANERDEYIASDTIIYKEGISNYDLESLCKDIAKPQYEKGILFHEDLPALKDHVFSQLTVVHAGGGIVFNENNEVLLILRNGKWDLPKGKLSDNESIQACAIREVMEETGLNQIEPGPEKAITYHSYVENGTRMLKETHWFEMSASSQQPLTPQQEEGIAEIRWVSPTDLDEYLKNTYATIAALLESYR